MSNRILNYPEATGITSDDYILLDNEGTGAKCIKASALNINMDNYTIKEARGAIASFDDGEDLPLAFMGAYITAIQDLHGYDYPWVGGAGKNKFDISDVSSSYWNVSGEQITNSITDTRQTLNLAIQGYYNNQYTGMNYLQESVSSTGKVSFTFTIGNNDNVDQLLVKHNGSLQDIIISFVNWTQKGDVTISFDVSGYNPTVVGGIVLSNIQIESGSTATSFAPYSNICPISGWSGVNVTVADATTSPTVSNVYTLTFTDGTNPLTVYGGKVDLVSGVLTVDRANVDLGTLNWQYSSIDEIFYVRATDLGVKATDVSTPFNAISSELIAKSYNEIDAKTVDYAIGINPNATQFFAKYSSITSASDFITAMNGVQLVYELATPLTYQLSKQQIRSLVGENNIFADTGDSIVDYRKLWVKPEM